MTTFNSTQLHQGSTESRLRGTSAPIQTCAGARLLLGFCRANAMLSWLSVKWRSDVLHRCGFPPLRGGDFQGVGFYRPMTPASCQAQSERSSRPRPDEPGCMSLRPTHPGRGTNSWDDLKHGSAAVHAASGAVAATGSCAVEVTRPIESQGTLRVIPHGRGRKSTWDHWELPSATPWHSP